MDAATGGEYNNVAIGSDALGSENSNADYCVAIGREALALQNADVKNTAIGGLAGDAIEGGDENTYVGYAAGSASVDVDGNTAIGHMAYVKGTGASNTVIGGGAGSSAKNSSTALSGDDNVIIGRSAGYDLTTGPGNVLVGRSAGANMTIGDYNIAIGFEAAVVMVGSSDNNIAIGKRALQTEASGANSVSYTHLTLPTIYSV